LERNLKRVFGDLFYPLWNTVEILGLVSIHPPIIGLVPSNFVHKIPAFEKTPFGFPTFSFIFFFSDGCPDRRQGLF